MTLYFYFIASYLDISTIISTPAILIKRAFTDAHRPFLRAGRLMTNMQMTFASIPNPQQTAIITPSTINFNKSEYSGMFSNSSLLFSIFLYEAILPMQFWMMKKEQSYNKIIILQTINQEIHQLS